MERRGFLGMIGAGVACAAAKAAEVLGVAPKPKRIDMDVKLLRSGFVRTTWTERNTHSGAHWVPNKLPEKSGMSRFTTLYERIE